MHTGYLPRVGPLVVLVSLSLPLAMEAQQVSPPRVRDTRGDYSIAVRVQRGLRFADAPHATINDLLNVFQLLGDDQRVPLPQLSPVEQRGLENRIEEQRFKIGITRDIRRTLRVTGLTRAALRGRGNLTYSRGRLELSPDGTLVWTSEIQSPGATALRLLITNVDLPSGTRIFVTDGSEEVHGPYAPAEGPIWSNTVFGNRVFVQVQIPAAGAARAANSFVIAQLAHMEEEIGQQPDLEGAQRLECGLLRFCRPASSSPDPQQRTLEKASLGVAKISFQSGGSWYVCSGALLRDGDESTQVPFFLTARHCVGTTTSARSVEAFWRFRRECGGSDPANPPRTRGSTLLASSSETDFALLQLSQNPPPGSHFFSWTTQDISGSTITVYRVHHPAGRSQHYQISQVRPRGGCSSLPRGNFIYSNPQQGGTAGGSSGSIVFRDNSGEPEIVGQLYGACFVGETCGYANVDGAFARTHAKVRQYIGDAPGGPTQPGTGPIITFIEPNDGSQASTGSKVPISVRIVDDASVSRAELFWDHTGNSLACPGTNNTNWWCSISGDVYRWEILLGDEVGDRRYHVRAVDGVGNVTTSPVRVLKVVPRPDGQILFVSEQSGRRDIYRVNADGSGLIRLTTGTAANYAPSWSPDGSYISFVSERRGRPELFVMDGDGQNQQPLAELNVRDERPRWRPATVQAGLARRRGM